VAVVTAGLLLGVAGGGVATYMRDQAAQERIERARAADSARWQGQADAYLEAETARAALERAWAADSARWAGGGQR